MLWWMLDLAMVNAYVCYAADCEKMQVKKMPRVEFQTAVAAALMGDDAPTDLFSPSKRRGHSSDGAVTRGEKEKENRPPSQAKRPRVDNEEKKPKCAWPCPTKASKQGNCRHCYLTKVDEDGNKKVTRPSWVCEGCEVHLCVGCFSPYHKPMFSGRHNPELRV